MDQPKRSRQVVVINPQGLHARPTDAFARLALRFQSQIELVKESERVDGKSILSILTLAAMEGTKLSIEATGSDADEALEALAALFTRTFAEE